MKTPPSRVGALCSRTALRARSVEARHPLRIRTLLFVFQHRVDISLRVCSDLAGLTDPPLSRGWSGCAPPSQLQDGVVQRGCWAAGPHSRPSTTAMGGRDPASQRPLVAELADAPVSEAGAWWACPFESDRGDPARPRRVRVMHGGFDAGPGWRPGPECGPPADRCHLDAGAPGGRNAAGQEVARPAAGECLRKRGGLAQRIFATALPFTCEQGRHSSGACGAGYSRAGRSRPEGTPIPVG